MSETVRAEPLRRFNPYPAYEDSGVAWLGEIPAHWEVKPLKYLLRAPLAYGVLKPDKYDGDDGVHLIRILEINHSAGLSRYHRDPNPKRHDNQSANHKPFTLPIHHSSFVILSFLRHRFPGHLEDRVMLQILI